MSEDKQLRDKAIDIKGKKYVIVADRVVYFNDTFRYGSITTDLISSPEAETVVIKATVVPDHNQNRRFTGYSQATWGDGYINKTSALENAETSAVGRALAFMGIGVIESIASVDEINKAAGKNPTKEAEQRFDDKRISPVNIREFWKEVRKSGWSNEQVAAYLGELGHKQTESVRQSEYDQILQWARSKPPVPQDLTPVLQESLAMVEAQKSVKPPANAKERVVEAVREVKAGTAAKPGTDPFWKNFWVMAAKHNIPEGDIHQYAKDNFGMKASLKELDQLQIGQLIGWVTSIEP